MKFKLCFVFLIFSLLSISFVSAGFLDFPITGNVISGNVVDGGCPRDLIAYYKLDNNAEDYNLVSSVYSSQGRISENKDIEYDDEGRVVKVKDRVTEYIEEYVYDDEDQVIIERTGYEGNLQERRIFYDGDGNIYAEDYGYGNIVYRNYAEDSYCIDSSAGHGCFYYGEEGTLDRVDAETLYGFDKQYSYDEEGNLIGESGNVYYFDDVLDYSFSYDDEDSNIEYDEEGRIKTISYDDRTENYYTSYFGVTKVVVPEIEKIYYHIGEGVFVRDFFKADYDKDGFIDLKDIIKSVDRIGRDLGSIDVQEALEVWRQ